MPIRTQTAPKPPVDPAKYRPSKQVRHVIYMITELRHSRPGMSTMINESEERFNTGLQHGQAVILRALVELETRIEDSDILDQLIGDMIEDTYASMG